MGFKEIGKHKSKSIKLFIFDDVKIILNYENKLLKNKTEERSNWKRYDSEFHQTLVRNCNSKNLIELHKLIFDKYLRYQLLVLTFRGSSSIEEHKKLLDYSLERNFKKAQIVLEEHIQNGIIHANKNF